MEILQDYSSLRIPSERRRTRVRARMLDHLVLSLPPNLKQSIDALAQSVNVSSLDVFLSVLKVLLFRYTDQPDIAVALPLDKSASVTVVRSFVAEEISFRDFLLQESESRSSAPTLIPVSGNPLFQIMLLLSETDNTFSRLPDLPFEIAFCLRENGSDWELLLYYNTEISDPDSMSRMAGHFCTLLEGAIANPDALLHDLPLLSVSERQELLEEWNQTQTEYPDDACLHDLFQAQAILNPARLAVVYADEVLTYRELNNRANQLAHYLARLGLGVGACAGVYMHRSPDIIIALLAILKTGAAYVPLDPNDPPSRLALVLEEAKAAVFITKQDMLENLSNMQTDSHIIALDNEYENLSKESTKNLQEVAGANDLAYILFTSGSTGKPKGTCCHHTGVINLLDDFTRRQPLFPGDAGSIWTAQSFDVSVYEIWSALTAGACLHIPPDEIRVDPHLFLDWMARSGIVSAYLPPFMLHSLAEWQTTNEFPIPLRRLLVGVEPVTESLLTEIQAKTPGLALINGYGPTEATVCATLYDTPAQPLTIHPGNAPIGRPVQNMQVYVLDKHMQPVPIGIAGELYIGGVALAKGYLNQPELTAEKFIRNPFLTDSNHDQPESRLYRTGDKVRYLSDGNLYFLERLDSQVKLRGFRIELGDVESTLREFEAVRDAVVLVREDTPGDKRLVAYITTGENFTPDQNGIRDIQRFLKERLPRQMRPSAIVALAELPQTIQGKIDRKVLPIPDWDARNTPVVEPQTDTEKEIARLWAEVLGIAEISRDDDFFALGGDSLMAIRSIARLSKSLRIRLPIQIHFEHSELSALAKEIDATRATLAPAMEIQPQTQTGPMPLSFDQQLVWFFEQLNPGTPTYHITQAHRLHGDLSQSTLKRSLAALVERQQSLRTVFVVENETPAQIVCPSGTVSLEVIDLQSMPLAEREMALHRHLKELASRPFDLVEGPLYRFALIRTSKTEAVLSTTLHHIVSDGWSVGVFSRELSVLYQALLEDFTPSLPALPIQYCDYAIWQRDQFSTQSSDSLAYWKERLRGPLPYIEWPVDHELPVILSNKGASHPIKLGVALSDRIHALGQESGTTLFNILGTLFHTLLYRYLGQEDLMIGTTMASRNLVETENLIGFFINTLILRLDLSGDPSFRELLERMRQSTMGAFAHQDIPFQKLVEESQPKGERRSMVQALFLMQTMDIPPLDFPAVTSTAISVKMNKANVDLTLELFDSEFGIGGWFEYRTDIFSRTDIARLSNLFKRITEAVLDDYGLNIARLPSISDIPKPEDYPLSPAQQGMFYESITTAGENAADALTPMQQGMLLQSLRSPELAGVYIEQVVLRLTEPVIVPILLDAWDCIIARHSALRTYFAWENLREPRQYVATEVTLPFFQEDWRDLSHEEQDKRMVALILSDRQQGMNLAEPPLTRLTLVQRGDTNFDMIWTIHHTLVDGRSMQIVLQEVFACYGALCRNETISLPPVVPYRQYVEFLQQLPDHEAELFWRKRLQGFSEATALPLPHPQVSAFMREKRQKITETMTGALEHALLDEEMTAALYDFAETHDLTLNVVVQGAWALLLSRYSGENDIVFGATKATRHVPNVASASSVGVYINTLPIRVQVLPEAPLLPWLTEVRQQWINLRQHEHVPLTKIRKWSEIRGNAPLFETYLMFERATIGQLLKAQGGNWTSRECNLLERTPLPLILAIYGGSNLKLTIEYDRRRFEQEGVLRILAHLQMILGGMLAHPNALLGDLPMLTIEEEKNMLQMWQSSSDIPGTPKDQNLVHNVIEAVAERTPDAIALRSADVQISYRTLNESANQMAHSLQQQGIDAESLVGICLPRSPESIIALLAVLKAGGAYLPLDADYPLERLEMMVNDADLALVITNSDSICKLPKSLAATICMDNDADKISQQPITNPVSSTTLDNMAYVIYTSGSTGRPKGVVIEHRALAAFVTTARARYQVCERDRVLQFASLNFDAAVEEIFCALTSGATLVLRTKEMAHSTSIFYQMVQEWGITVLDLPTAFWHAMTDQLDEEGIPESVRLVIIGGEAARNDKLEIWRQHVKPGVVLMNTYGPTEATVIATWFEIDSNHSAMEIPIGRPLPGLSAYVLDHYQRPVPIGVPGELFIGGPQLARGYINRPDLTDERFIYLKETTSGKVRATRRLYKTGDRVCFRPDGQLVYLGRFDRQVKIRGFRIELGEIEAILQSHEAVRHAMVLAADNKRLLAYIVPEAKQEAEELRDELAQWLAKQLPEHMRPRFIIIIDSIPLTPSNKIDYKALPTPEEESPAEVGEAELSRDSMEIQLCRIWEEVLEVAHIGREDNFFDQGGHSLLALTLLARVEKSFGIRIHPLRFFQAPTVVEQVAVLRDEGCTTPWRSLVPIKPQGSRPPFFVVGSTQMISVLSRYLDSDQPLYCLTILGFQRKDKTVPDLSVEKIAEQYVEEIRTVQPKGPYFVAGYCLSSLIVFEMARQIISHKETLGKVIFIDSVWDWIWEKETFLSMLRRHVLNVWRMRSKYVIKQIKMKQDLFRTKTNRIVTGLEKKFYRTKIEDVALDLNQEFTNALFGAYKTYKPEPLPIRVILYLVSEWCRRDAPTLSRFAEQGVEVTIIDGMHGELFDPPQIENLCEKLCRCLEDAYREQNLLP